MTTETTARADWPRTSSRNAIVELRIAGPSQGNPFTEVEFSAHLTDPRRSFTVGGFYDGDGAWVVRLLADTPGEWHFRTVSTAEALDGITGTFTVTGEVAAHGVVRVSDSFHFRHDDGTRYLPIGTTAYAWTHQPAELQEQTLRTLGGSPFNKLRMCVFPKSYLYNSNEPELYPFERSGDGGWDFTRFDPAFFRQLERRIADLAALGVEADLILFHPYDRWGFADMGAVADDLYVSYLARRLAAFPNVWWSMANEYDLMTSKTEADWERLAHLVVASDPWNHLISIHNCLAFYDYSRAWITHCSVQRIDVYRTAENTDEWRRRWGKPVVIDECAYEGDIDMGWGNITGEELVRRFWEGALRGGYVGHGETYYRDDEVLWWAKGGELHGESSERIRFLAQVIADSPTGVLEPLPSEWDAPWAGVEGEYLLVYFGFNRPRFRTVQLPEGRWLAEVLDTWELQVTPVGELEGTARIDLPGRQFVALRFRRIGPGRPDGDSPVQG